MLGALSAVTLGRVCETCQGRGRVYRAPLGWRVCETCGGAGPRQAQLAQLEAIDALCSCWRSYQLGDTAALNLELAVRRCLDAGLDVDQIHRRTNVSREQLRRVAGGQGLML
jgi:hypothetical protein